MIFLLDTNAASNIIRAKFPALNERIAAHMEAGAGIALPVIVVHELWYGVFRSPNPARRAERVRVFMSELAEVAPFTEHDAEIAAEIRQGLATKGEMIGYFDLLIAAQALRLNATLVTNNVREFARVPGLVFEDWSSEAVVQGKPDS
jgi:tRNA(fMet)-specific endonuclease VapC